MEVVYATRMTPAEHARELMAEHGLRRLPVIDREDRLVGIIKLADLEGEQTSIKKALKVIFHKEKTDSTGVRTTFR